ncbi:MAG: YmdB family metallophosphoesterase [bacterium]|nr:YmdB family metallophosphoesterase [bacterium]
MNLLFIGDIVGKGGRQAVKRLVPELRQKYSCSFCIANAENSACGAGINEKCIKDLNDVVDVFTLGDHVWDQKTFANEIKGIKNVVRPANVNPIQPGKGFDVFRVPAGGEVAVINLMGKVFMRNSSFCPFMEVDKILKKLPSTVKCILVDFHAEATSEMLAMGRFLDGRVTAVLGTHTHVQTADARVFEKGTAYITDVGMVGADFSILGRSVDDVLYKFTTDMPNRLNVIEKGIMRFDAAVVSYNMSSGKATEIKPLSILIDLDTI